MKFAIRDDDVNFYTHPDEITHAYGSIWDVCPPTFSVITHVKGNWKYWTQEIYRLKHQIDWDQWKADNAAFAIAGNQPLVTFLREHLTKKKLDIAFHAVHHRNEDVIPPTHKQNNYVLGAEFYTSSDQTQKIKNALDYLGQLFKKQVTVFTPPQNLLSAQGYRAVLNNKLSIVGAGISFWKKENSWQGLKNMASVMTFKLKFPGKDYPYPLNFSNHAEIVHHYPLHPTTRLEDLIAAFEHVRRFDGAFVLSTHYHEFVTPLTYDPMLRMGDVFNRFMQHVHQTPGVQYLGLSDLFATLRLNTKG